MLRDNRDEQLAFNKLREQIDYLMEIGEKAYDLNDFDHAFRAYRRALEIAYTIKDYSILSTILANLTNVYVKLGKFDLAEGLYREAIERLKSRELRKPEESELRHYLDLQQLELRHSALSSMRRPSSRLIFSFILSLILLFAALVIFWVTRNPLTLLILQIPVFIFGILENLEISSMRRSR